MTTPDNRLTLESFATPENFRIVLETLQEILPTLTEILKERLVEQTKAIVEISQKFDQLITREIHGGLDAINDAASSSNDETKHIRLRFAEEQLLKNTQLDPKLETAGKRNGYWMAQSHQGLMNICLLRDDGKIANKHLLSMFECDPHLARTKLAPEVWKQIFEPECQQIYDWYKKEQEKIANDPFKGRVTLRKAGAVAIFAAKGGLIATSWWLNKGKPGGGGMPAGGTVIIDQAKQKLSEDWEDATPERYRQNALEKLDKVLEAKLDERCRQYAIKLIAAL
jgi:hypothetical protein